MNRDTFLKILYKWSLIPYQFFKGNTPWKIHLEDLKEYPPRSLGSSLAKFLIDNGFLMQAKLESHDIFHILTGTGTTVPEEISMQFYLFGNGKRSPCGFIVMTLGSILYLEKWRQFHISFLKSRKSHPFTQINFEKLLHLPLLQLQEAFYIIQNTNHEKKLFKSPFRRYRIQHLIL